MATRTHERTPPRGWARWLLRAPIRLYEIGLGPLLGGRLLLLESIGARTGLPRLTVLEVVEHDAATDTFYAAAGFGPNSDWYRNVLHRPEVQITVGRRRCRVYASPVEAGRAGEILIDYARRYPRMARAFMRFMGFEVDGSDDDYRQVVRSLGLHLIAFTPRMAETNSWTSNNH